MEKNDPRTPSVEKNLFTKLSSLGNEEVDEMERLRRKFIVMEVKIDEIYNHLLSTKTIDPRKNLIDKLNILSIALLTTGLLIPLIGLMLPDDSMTFASVGISASGIVLIGASIYLQSSSKAKDNKKRSG